MKNSIGIILMLVFASNLCAQSSSKYEKRLYDSYVAGKIIEWPEIMLEMDASYKISRNTDLLYSLCFAQYGYVGHCISKNMDDEAKSVLNDAIKNSKELEEIFNGRHDILALQAAFLGYKIMLSKFSSLYLGPKAFKLIKKASKSSQKYFNCSLEYGNFRYFTPRFHGGSKEEAISYYKNAVRLLQRSSEKYEHSWIYINTSLLLAHAYYDTNKSNLACRQYQKILDYEPKINWIRDEYKVRCK